MNVGELIRRLTELAADASVAVEGCDCEAPLAFVSVEEDGEVILRRDDGWRSKR